MSRLLYIESSPRKKRSSSIQVAHTFLEAYQNSHPTDEVETIDLWHTSLPEFDGDVIDSKYAIMHGQSHTEAQRKSWQAVENLIKQFKNADQYLFSVPMWNFSIPYKLKHYIDLIVQPGYTFSFSPAEGYQGLIKDKPVVVIYARGGSYGPGTAGESLDFQKNYFEEFLKFIGFTNVQSVFVEPTLAGDQQKEEIILKANQEAIKIANGL